MYTYIFGENNVKSYLVYNGLTS